MREHQIQIQTNRSRWAAMSPRRFAKYGCGNIGRRSFGKFEIRLHESIRKHRVNLNIRVYLILNEDEVDADVHPNEDFRSRRRER